MEVQDVEFANLQVASAVVQSGAKQDTLSVPGGTIDEVTKMINLGASEILIGNAFQGSAI